MPIGGALKLKGVPINKDKYVQHNPSMPPSLPFHDDDDDASGPSPPIVGQTPRLSERVAHGHWSLARRRG